MLQVIVNTTWQSNMLPNKPDNLSRSSPQIHFRNASLQRVLTMTTLEHFLDTASNQQPQHISCPRAPNGALSDLRQACQRDKHQQTPGLRVQVLHRRTLSAANTGQTKDRELLLYTSCEKIRQLQGLAAWIIAAHQWRQQHSANSLHEASCAAVFLDPAWEWLQTSCFR